MRFLRTASTPRLLATFAAVLALGVGVAAIALAAAGGPVPPPKPLAQAIHDGLGRPAVDGLSARIRFTNHLIGSSNIQGSDPVLTGATGRLWIGAGHRLRLELQSDSGDAQIVSDGRTISLYDAASRLAYSATLPRRAGAGARETNKPPSLASIQSDLTRLMEHAGVSDAKPGDVAGRPTYTVRLTPRHGGGLLGAAELAWDAERGVPLRAAIYAKGDDQPVIELEATQVSYGPIPASTFDVHPPDGTKVVALDASRHGAETRARAARQAPVTGVAAVGRALPFALSAPDSLGGRPRNEVRLLALGGHPAALVTYGSGLDGIAVLEQRADTSGPMPLALGRRRRHEGAGLSLPSVSIGGARAQELPTALGTLVRFTRGGVTYTVAGSVPPAAAEAAARGL